MAAAFERFNGHRTVVVRWQPTAKARAQVLCVPAFGDEMSQTRRMVRLAAEGLAERAIASVVFDLLGTGDSSAEFDEASVEDWLDDLATMLARMRSESDAPVVLFGCRLGVALAVELTRRAPESALAVVGWAPVLQGRMQLSAMLRAAKIAQQRRPGTDDGDAKAVWAEGRIAHLAGYPISPALAAQLERLDASAPPRVRAATLIDVRLPQATGVVEPSEALQTRAARWREQGVEVETLAVEGPPFWNVPDLVDVPALVDMTVDAIDRHVGAAGR